SSTSEEVDTVAFACFRKSVWSELGGFNEKLLTNEDYDFNYRVRQRGSKIILDRAEHCDYFARTEMRSLAAQYLRYGFWKAQMVKQQPLSLKLRHLVAPAFVSAVAILGLLGLVSVIGRYALAFSLALYLSAAFVFAVHAVRQRNWGLKLALRLPFIFATIHFCWGASFLFGIVKSPRG
ncbi:MAG TPA: glycosyltransferase family 2 protein, partial [Pyrinomonadaceae bacterium]|nr:glycosyltransferase family 2 protein [Pyrinomonadaceae bacterium]